MDAAADHSSFLREQSFMDSSSEQVVSQNKKYHRHTLEQIQELETFFKECSHPHKKQIAELGRKLGLEIKQVKFWFQNKRIKLKAQSERQENQLLKQQHEMLLDENQLLKEAYTNAICHSCGGTGFPASVPIEHEQLWIENVQLKHKLQQISCLIIGEPSSSNEPKVESTFGGQ